MHSVLVFLYSQVHIALSGSLYESFKLAVSVPATTRIDVDYTKLDKLLYIST